MANGIFPALTYPLETGDIILPAGRILLVNMPYGREAERFPPERTICWNWMKQDAAEWIGAGYKVQPDAPSESFEAVFLALPQQRDNALGLLAQTAVMLGNNGLLIAGAPNDSGGRRLAGDMEPCCRGLHMASKNKCRIVWARRKNLQDLPHAWTERAAPCIHPDTAMWTQPGLFSWDRIDPATALLLPFIPAGEGGSFMDAGCGNGVITAEILRHNPGASHVSGLDADYRALDMCRRNAASIGSAVPFDIFWEDFTRFIPQRKVDWVIMNPPFHQGKKEAIALGQQFITSAAACLKPGGILLIVANAHLPYEKILQPRFARTEKCHEGQGFKIFKAWL